MTGKLIKLFYVGFIILLFASCEKNDVDPKDDDQNNGDTTIVHKTIVIDATSYSDWVYFSFKTGDTVSIATPGTSTDWDLAFLRNHLKTNSGTSGSGKAGALDAGKITFADYKEAPESGYSVDDTIKISDPNDPTRQTMIDSPGNKILDGWGAFDYSGHPPLLTPSDHVYAVKTADGKYAKVWLKSYYNNEAKSGHVTMEYVYQSDGSRNLE